MTRGLLLFAGLVPLSLLVYGLHASDPPLSDDFVSLRTAQRGLEALVRGATVDSYPRTMRPLPALVWALRRGPADLSLIHLAGFAVHGANAALVGLLALRLAASPTAAAFAAVAFVVFPLFAEPVLWASCGPDRLATLAGLAALCVWTAGAHDGRRVLALALCTGAALLSKESLLTLPFICLALRGTRHPRAILGAFAPLALYVAARLTAVGGIGGYDAAHTPAGWQTAGERLGLTLFVHLPYLTLVPLSAGAWQRWLLGALSAALLVLSLHRLRVSVWRRLLPIVTLALLPVLPVLGLDADRLGARFFYWPVAVALAVLASALPAPNTVQRAAWAGLALLWTGAAVANGRPWSAAGAEVSRTIEAMRRAQPAIEAGTLVMVAARDSVGAYVFRNGLPEAAEVLGLRRDIRWRRGTAADLSEDEIHRLGQGIRVLGIGAAASPRDLTDCERSLYEAPGELRTLWPAHGPSQAGASDRAIIVRPAPTNGPTGVAAALRIDGAAPHAQGLVQWRRLTEPFSMARSRTFRPAGKPETYVRLDSAAAVETEIRVILPASATRSELRLVETGLECPAARE